MKTIEQKIKEINKKWNEEYSRIRLASALKASGELLDFFDKAKVVFVDNRHDKKDFIYFEIDEKVKAIAYSYNTGDFSIHTSVKRIMDQAKANKKEFPKKGKRWERYFSLSETETEVDANFLHDLFDFLIEQSDELNEMIMFSRYKSITKQQNSKNIKLLCEFEQGSIEVYLKLDDKKVYLGEASDILDELA